MNGMCAVAFVAPLDEIRPDDLLKEVFALAGGRDIDRRDDTQERKPSEPHGSAAHEREPDVIRSVCHSLYENVV
jgi:hypothetical protein